MTKAGIKLAASVSGDINTSKSKHGVAMWHGEI